MADTTPQAVQSAHELLLWLIPQLDKLPRVRRFTVGERLEVAIWMSSKGWSRPFAMPELNRSSFTLQPS